MKFLYEDSGVCSGDICILLSFVDFDVVESLLRLSRRF